MKRNITVIAALFVFCGSAFAQYWTGDGGKGIRLAVLEPEGKGISENEKWTLSVVQNVIYTDFSKYSGMTIIDRQNLEKVFEEWKESMSGHYSDEERVKIGNLTNASHILNGTVIKTPNAFMLELSVTDLQSGERKASYSQPVSAAALENHSAIKEASAELLKQLGVNLTSAALGELKQTANIARIQAEEALARGIVAKRQGTEVAALSYFYQAAALDPTMLEAANRSSVMEANISSGNIGADTRNDILWRRDWVARLKEAEQFFDNLFKTNPLPYTLFYSTKIIPGEINYQTETQTLSINTNLHATGAWIWLSSVEKALQAVYDGLDATKRKKDWGLRDWPWSGVTELKPFERKERTFSIAAELLNDKGKVIGKANFKSEGSWQFNGYDRPKIHISDDDRKQVEFASVRADDITDRITIRIASVNGIEASTAAKTGVLQIKAISEAKWDSYVSFRIGRNGITGYNGEGGDLVIPDSIWDDPVTAIGENVFRYRSITNITIGKNVEIHNSAFDNKFSEFYTQERRRAGTYIPHKAAWISIEMLMTDKRDGKKYKTVKIGKQIWMADNLNYEASGSKCYENKPKNCTEYGRLYDWETAKNACPSGWHLPSESEWKVLDKAVGGEKVAGKKLKAKSGWNNNGNGTDEFGFSAVPGGNGNSDGSFYGVGSIGLWWSANEYHSNSAYSRYMSYHLYVRASWNIYSKSDLFSVRCVQD